MLSNWFNTTARTQNSPTTIPTPLPKRSSNSIVANENDRSRLQETFSHPPGLPFEFKNDHVTTRVYPKIFPGNERHKTHDKARYLNPATALSSRIPIGGLFKIVGSIQTEANMIEDCILTLEVLVADSIRLTCYLWHHPSGS